MAGLDKNTPHPTQITQHQLSKTLEVSFADGKNFVFPFEFLRVHSPSAEVRGHHPSQKVLQVGKKDVFIKNIEPVGHYAIKIQFSDGHDTGIYSWDYLYAIGSNKDALWQQYLDEMIAAGASREDAATAKP